MLDRIRHALIRRKANVEAVPTDRFSVEMASSAEDYAQAFNLVQVSYAALGIAHLGRTLYRMTDQHVLPEAFVLLAREQGRVVGTITVTLDSPAGLPLDEDYPGVVDTLRVRGARLAEIGSYAVVHRCRHSGVAQALGIAAARLIWSESATHTVIGIHPKMQPIYAALWGFEPCGRRRDHSELVAPVAAMVVSRERQQDHVRRRYGRHQLSGRTMEDLVFGHRPPPNMSVVATASNRSTRSMDRETFQTLFMHESDHLRTLKARTRTYLKTIRSDETLGTLRLVGS